MSGLMRGKKGVVLGVANQRSIAWAIATLLQQEGANLAVTYQNERFEEGVRKLCAPFNMPGRKMLALQCDVSKDEDIASLFRAIKEQMGAIDFFVHSIAYANREDLGGDPSALSRTGFQIATEVSAYSLIPLVDQAFPLMARGGNVITLTFQASERVFPGYNVMAYAKAALEVEILYLVPQLAEKEICINALSPGPIETLAARGISGFMQGKAYFAQRAPLGWKGNPEVVAKAALALCAGFFPATTGEVIHLDGGFHMIV